MTPEDFFYKVFESLPRQGPGCPGATRKAYSYIPDLPKDAAVLDVGCGSGAQTRVLAELTTGTIIGVDNHVPFIDAVTAWAKEEGLDKRIRAIQASMDSLPFGNQDFDLIWSEGAIFIMGFEQGLNAWKPLLRDGGFMAVSDAVLFESNPPAELVKFWEEHGYPLLFEQQRAQQIRQAGLRLIASYHLPEAGWWEYYYVPMLALVTELRKTYGHNPPYAAILDSRVEEAEMYRKYKRYYGYTFFVMKNP